MCIVGRLKAYLCTEAHALFSLYRGLDCSADTMARSDEKFFRIRHSWRQENQRKSVRTCVSEYLYIQRCVSADLSNVDPALDDPRPDMRSDLSVFQHSADHAGRHGVKLGDGSTDGGGAVLVVLLIPLRPNRAEAVVGHDLFKQQLENNNRLILVWRRWRNITGTFSLLRDAFCQPFPCFHLISPHLPNQCRSAAQPPGLR